MLLKAVISHFEQFVTERDAEGNESAMVNSLDVSSKVVKSLRMSASCRYCWSEVRVIMSLTAQRY